MKYIVRWGPERGHYVMQNVDWRSARAAIAAARRIDNQHDGPRFVQVGQYDDDPEIVTVLYEAMDYTKGQ